MTTPLELHKGGPCAGLQMEMEEAARLQLREREATRPPSAARTAFEDSAPMQVPSQG